MDRKGYLVFHGGDAFTAENRDTDRVWLKPLRKQQHNPRLMPNADKLMKALFGPDWRDLCASGSSTSQSSTSDGGR